MAKVKKGNYSVKFQLKENGKNLNSPMTAIVPNVGSETLAGNRIAWHARHIGLEVDILGAKATDQEAERLKPVRLELNGDGKAAKKTAAAATTKAASKKPAAKAGKKAAKGQAQAATA